MQIQVLSDNFDIENFDGKVHHPLQSWAWGEARKKMGIKVLRISDGKDFFQLTFHPVPYTRHLIGYLPRSVWPSNSVLNFLYEYGKEHKVIFIKIEPNVERSDHNLQTTTHNLISSPHPLFPQWTQNLDLTKTEEEILKNMHPKTRYNIRLAEKKGVKVRSLSNAQGFRIFSKLYFDTCRRQKYFGHTPQYHQIIWESLKNNIAHILVAFYKDTPLATYELFYFNKVFYYPYGGTSEIHRNLMASNLLMWEAIKTGKKLGAGKFDMWGSLPPNYDMNHPWAGFTRFKEGYGTKFVEMIGSFDLVINPAQYRIYNILSQARSQYLKLTRFFR